MFLCIMFYVICLPDALMYKNTRQKGHRNGCVLRYGVQVSSHCNCLVSSFFVLHLKQKHEEGQRLLHYLQQTNTALTTGTFIYVINQVICGYEIKCLQS